MLATTKIIKIYKCKWCGTEYIKNHNRQVYCTDYCSKESEKEKGRNRFRKYYHKYKNLMTEEKRCGLGSGFLGMHRDNDFNKEFDAIQTEMKRIGIKANSNS